MTGPFYAFPDVLMLVADAVAVFVPSIDHTGSETPADLEERLPFIRVMHGGGVRDRLNDNATLDIDVFASTYDEGERLAEKVSQFLCGPPPPIPAIDSIDGSPPQELPWNDDGSAAVRRFGASYSVVSRRRRWLT